MTKFDAAANERELWTLIAAGDLDAFASRLLPGARFVDGEGIQSKEQLVQTLREITLESFDLSDVDVISPCDGMRIVVYRVQERVRTATSSAETRAAACSVWVEQDGGWAVAVHQETPVP